MQLRKIAEVTLTQGRPVIGRTGDHSRRKIEAVGSDAVCASEGMETNSTTKQVILHRAIMIPPRTTKGTTKSESMRRGLRQLPPDYVFIVAAIVKRVDLAGCVPVKEYAALHSSAKEQVAGLRKKPRFCSSSALHINRAKRNATEHPPKCQQRRSTAGVVRGA